ncbi:MAG TPA: hypothetical protein VGL31_01990 [Xanthobacteraceae bacterium]
MLPKADIDTTPEGACRIVPEITICATLAPANPLGISCRIAPAAGCAGRSPTGDARCLCRREADVSGVLVLGTFDALLALRVLIWLPLFHANH